jgi:hypothetical protein
MIVCLSVATPCQKMRVLSKFFMTFVSDRTHKLHSAFRLSAVYRWLENRALGILLIFSLRCYELMDLHYIGSYPEAFKVFLKPVSLEVAEILLPDVGPSTPRLLLRHMPLPAPCKLTFASHAWAAPLTRRFL